MLLDTLWGGESSLVGEHLDFWLEDNCALESLRSSPSDGHDIGGTLRNRSLDVV